MDLDNPAWAALRTEHAAMALGGALARRYPREVSPLTAISAPTPQAFAELADLAEPGEVIGFLWTSEVDVPQGWEVLLSRWIEQMVFEGPGPAPRPGGPELLTLGAADAEEMLALATETQPGPFALRTHEMGTYLGVRVDGRLVAMAGERMRTADATELSGICTDPAFTGRGHARALIAALLERVLEQGRQPFLHVKTENAAVALYERLGFRVRRPMRFTVMRR